MFNFNKIFKQAWVITKTQKSLWFFGLLLVLGNLSNVFPSSEQAKPTALQPWMILIIFIGFIIFLLLFARAKASLILAVKAILDKQSTSIKQAWQGSRFFYWRLLGIAFIISFGTGILLLILSQPVIHFVNQGDMVPAWTLGILAGLIFLPVIVGFLLVNVLAPLFVVIFDRTIQESLDNSFNLIKQFFAPILGLGILLFLLQIIPVVILAGLNYYIHGLPAKIVSLVAVSLIQIFVTIFAQTAWVIAFLDLIKPQKFEAEPVVAPEIIS